MNDKSHKPLKRFGQNYLTDENIVKKIISLFDPKPDDSIIEIGPGRGVLTKNLIEQCNNVTAVEIDSRTIALLNDKFPNLKILNEDFLKINLTELIENKTRIIGNIPYNITSPILFKLIEHRALLIDTLFMIQYEVAQRILGKQGTKNYGILSVLLQYFAEVKLCFKVPPTVFYPRPKIDSAVIQIRWKDPISTKEEDCLLIKIVKAAFGNRRKMIKNSFKNSIFESYNFSEIINTSLRAEQLSIEDFVKLVQFIKSH